MFTMSRSVLAVCALGLVALLATACSSPEASMGGETVGTWTLTGPMIEGRAEHASVLLADGRVLVVGGCARYQGTVAGFGTDCPALDTAEIYDPITGVWTPAGTMSEARRNPAVAQLRDGRVLVAGGCSGPRDYGCTSSAELFDPAGGTWTATSDMGRPRASLGGGSTVLLPSGKVLVADGYEPDYGTAAPSGEVYDPASGTWAFTGPLVMPRYSASRAVLLPSGQVLLVGGAVRSPTSYGTNFTAQAELYDPATNLWEATGVSSSARTRHTLTLLPTGEVLMAGGRTEGFDEPETEEAELYSPATGTWRAAPAMHFRRREARAVLLPSGRVLVVGNWTRCPKANECDPYMAPNAELYDPGLDSWLLAPVPPRYVEDASALVLLPSGQALLAGGLAQVFGVRSAQLFQE